jgi:peptidyl-prolyl cis-trans isomerase SurA
MNAVLPLPGRPLPNRIAARKHVLRSTLRSTMLACATMCMVASGASAQTVPDEDGQLVLPKDMQIFGKNDPNVRKATAIVNGRIITGTDVDQRLALILAANGGKVADDEKERLRVQVLRNLIDETLQIQEAAANDIKVDPAEVEQSFERVAGNFRQSPSQFEQYLRTQGSAPASIKRQTKGSDEFKIGEIYLSASPENQQQIIANAKNIIEQIKGGGSFAAYARQFSEASTAAVGGDLGWVRPAQLPDELAAAATDMQVGQIAGPIPVPGGMSIIYVMDKRKVLTADPRDALLSLKQLSIAFPTGTTKEQASARAASFAASTKAIKGCGEANALGTKMGADVVDNDNVKVRDLPPQLQDMLLGLQIGESTPPFGSIADGVRVLILCGRDEASSANAPNYEQIQAQMEEERVNKRARIYLRDLRRDAVIDYN